MSFAPFRHNRVVVPRWRPFARTIAAGELSFPKSVRDSLREVSPELTKRLAKWRVNPTVLSVSEVIETAIVDGNFDEAIRPARSLIARESAATPFLREQAALVLQQTGQSDSLPSQNNETAASPIALARWRTRAFQHDPYAWVDLALAYTVNGKNHPAERAMRVALQLAPHDRYVLRSAARLFLHLGDQERAHDLLKNSQATRTDPWVMAAEIALSQLADRKPSMLKIGTRLLDEGGLQPRHTSELASAIATVHLRDGRRAKKLFNASLIDPTGNSLAQAEWANPHVGNLVNPASLARVNDSAEARVFQSYWDGDFPEIIKQCQLWDAEEPFSSRPHQFGSGAAIAVEQFETALRFANEGIRINAQVPVLHNNRAYALIALGHFEEALPSLSFCLTKSPETSRGPSIATAGMLALRLGHHREGIDRYRDAIAMFKRCNNHIGVALAYAYFAQEAARGASL